MDTTAQAKTMIEKTRVLIEEFKKREQKEWGVEGSMIELMKQVGDLSRCVMMYENYYLPDRKLNPKYKTVKENIGDELFDLFYVIVRIADHYGVDLEQECDKEFSYSMKYFSKVNT